MQPASATVQPKASEHWTLQKAFELRENKKNCSVCVFWEGQGRNYELLEHWRFRISATTFSSVNATAPPCALKKKFVGFFGRGMGWRQRPMITDLQIDQLLLQVAMFLSNTVPSICKTGICYLIKIMFYGNITKLSRAELQTTRRETRHWVKKKKNRISFLLRAKNEKIQFWPKKSESLLLRQKQKNQKLKSNCSFGRLYLPGHRWRPRCQPDRTPRPPLRPNTALNFVSSK